VRLQELVLNERSEECRVSGAYVRNMYVADLEKILRRGSLVLKQKGTQVRPYIFGSLGLLDLNVNILFLSFMG
jgi:hypothetical protein